MSNLISLENISHSYGLKTLLDRVSLGLNTGERVGVVGLNGGGKSTLLRILYGSTQPDEGRVTRNNGLRMAMVTQDVLQEALEDDTLADLTVEKAVLDPVASHTYQWASNPKIRAVLEGLGVEEDWLDTPVKNLSGGQRRRVGLAAALVQDLDVLILDEPTNHLDIHGVQWLAQHLLARNTALVVVTHDRWFLDTVAITTWEVHDGTVDVYEGGYNDWVFARAERARQADAIEQRRHNLARKELAWLRRGAPARTSKPRYRIAAAEALIADVPAPRDHVELMKFSTHRQGKKVIDLVDATISTPDGHQLVKDLTWRLGPGERIGLVGANGSGKTTLLRALAGEYPLSAGRRVEGKTVRLGWLRQELDDLDPAQRLLDAVEDVASYVTVGDKELSAAQLAERLGFPAKMHRIPVGDLSGGQRRRLQLTRILMAEPNVLLLDEPTNDLDIDTLQELESLLDSWPGTLVVISHDRYLIERMCDSTWALHGGSTLTHLPGGIEQYLAHFSTHGTQHSQKAGKKDALKKEPGQKEPAHKGTEGTGQAHKSNAQKDRMLLKELQAVERKMDRLSQELDQLNTAMAELSENIADDPTATGRLTEVDQQARQIQREHEELENRWLQIAEQREAFR